MIKPCTCKHPFQDKRHGKGKRVHNEAGKQGGSRCTVCGATKFK
jgi:hypothetical protein